jgi:hypothetical protein
MQSMSKEPILALSQIFDDEIMQHYSGVTENFRDLLGPMG